MRIATKKSSLKMWLPGGHHCYTGGYVSTRYHKRIFIEFRFFKQVLWPYKIAESKAGPW